MRHTARTLYRELGHDGFAIGELLGQSNAQTATTYTHVGAAELRQMPERLLGLVDGNPVNSVKSPNSTNG